MKKFEHKTLPVHIDNLDKLIKDHEKDNWEVAATFPSPSFKNTIFIIFKREQK